MSLAKLEAKQRPPQLCPTCAQPMELVRILECLGGTHVRRVFGWRCGVVACQVQRERTAKRHAFDRGEVY